MRSVYQVSAGPTARSYADVFLRYGVALIAPGDMGRWPGALYQDNFAIGGFVRRFAEEIGEGDVVLLRTGEATIGAIGIVVGEYEYLEQFDDVYGLDLQHTRRVRWCKLPEEHSFPQKVFGAGPTRFSKVLSTAVVDFAERYLQSPPTHWQTAPLPDLPAEVPDLGAVPTPLRGVVAQAADLVPLYRDRARIGEPVSEGEIVAHFVVPFLRALGWPPERIAIEWRRVDVAVFRQLPRTPENCHLVIEAKRLDAGVEGALDQAMGYVKDSSLRCNIVVTDGVRYRMYSAEHHFAPVAYANLVRLKQPAADLLALMQRT